MPYVRKHRGSRPKRPEVTLLALPEAVEAFVGVNHYAHPGEWSPWFDARVSEVEGHWRRWEDYFCGGRVREIGAGT